jgi:hypothetical protein
VLDDERDFEELVPHGGNAVRQQNGARRVA